MSERENQIFTDYLGDPVSMCKRIAELEAERDRLRKQAICPYQHSTMTVCDKCGWIKALEDSDEL